jgi:subtilisin-like proprotein convertase family protein
MDMYQYRNDEIQVQNHSWGNSEIYQLGMSAIESIGVSNAVTRGRSGRGVVLVRAASNYRMEGANSNDDASGNDPRSIAVAAVRRDGRTASYSNPGASVLVGAPSADQDDPFSKTDTLFTTDQVGRSGYNAFGTGDLANYAFGSSGFDGTSGATPQISGIAALVLAANPDLTYRDVQQILIHASRYPNDSDPAIHRNGSGFQVGDNMGFGVPDAGEAVRLARAWSNRPPLQKLSFPAQVQLNVPDDGLRVIVTGTNNIEQSIRCAPTLGLHPDDPTPNFPLVSVGRATNELGVDLRGRMPLIERGGTFFKDKLGIVARAGAPFAVIFNNVNRDEIFQPDGTDYVPIPAVLIGETEGRNLLARLEAGEPLQARIELNHVEHTFQVTNTLSCEHVGLRVRASHDRRGDLRITLVSPTGTRSVLQRLNDDTEPGPDNWTYWSVQHFYEPSAGTWTATFADESNSVTGSILELELLIQGVTLEDTDADGLDDAWEQRWFGSLESRPATDPDADGLSNVREQTLGTNPTRSDRPLRIDLGRYDGLGTLRLSWPALDGVTYRVIASPLASSEFPFEIGQVKGRFPEGEWIVSNDLSGEQFFWVEPVSAAP